MSRQRKYKESCHKVNLTNSTSQPKLNPLANKEVSQYLDMSMWPGLLLILSSYCTSCSLVLDRWELGFWFHLVILNFVICHSYKFLWSMTQFLWQFEMYCSMAETVHGLQMSFLGSWFRVSWIIGFIVQPDNTYWFWCFYYLHCTCFGNLISHLQERHCTLGPRF
jgi:hypothetical protein